MRRFTEFDYGITHLSTMFHLDWVHEGSPLDVLHNKLWEGQDVRSVEILRWDSACLAENLPNQHVETLWTAGIGGSFAFPGLVGSGIEWMRIIERECVEWLREKPDPELSTADTDPGSAYLDEVLAVIDSLNRYGLDQQIPTALTACASTCAPELALRFTQRILSESDTTIDHGFYALIASLGESLGFGEFLVEDLKYLVE